LIILKIPCNLGSLKESHVEEAPDKIVEATKEFFFSDGFEVEEVEVIKDNVSETQENIEKKVREIDGFFVALGGDHSITYPIVKGLRRPWLLFLDAHPDCQSSFYPVSYEDVVRGLVEHDLVKGVIMLGVRNWSQEEREFMRKHDLNVFTANEVFERGMKQVTDEVMGRLKGERFYVSIDIDVFDPAFAPGTGWIEPGGLSSRDVIYLLRKLKLLKGFVGMDVVEVDPRKDVNDMTIKLAARLLLESKS